VVSTISERLVRPWVTFFNRSEASFTEELTVSEEGMDRGRLTMAVRKTPCPDVFISLLKVDRRYRGCGLGGHLLQAALDRYAGWDFLLRCSPLDNTGLSRDQLLEFYKKRGFRLGQGRVFELAPIMMRPAPTPTLRPKLPELRGPEWELAQIAELWG
jgi:GNAT superfamily N-acetyltransferase